MTTTAEEMKSMVQPITTEQLRQEGISEAHKEVFLKVAKDKKCIILTRTPGEACAGLLAEGYDAKSFHIKAKSCQSGVAAGFICFDPLFNKNGMEGLAANLYENNKSLTHGYEKGSSSDEKQTSGVTELKISEARLHWLIDKKYVVIQENNDKDKDKVKVGFFQFGENNKNKYSLKLELDSKNNTWKVLYQPKEIYNESFDKELDAIFEKKIQEQSEVEKLEKISYRYLYQQMKEQIGVETESFVPLLIMTNPHRNYTGDQAYLNAVVGDYDLFAIWPHEKAYNKKPSHFARLVPHQAGETPEQMSKKIKEKEMDSSIGKVVGNISDAVFEIAQLLNSVIGIYCPKEAKVNRVFHSDEGGCPSVTEVNTAVAFTPEGKCYLLKSEKDNNGQALVEFAREVSKQGYQIIINVGWQRAFENSNVPVIWPA